MRFRKKLGLGFGFPIFLSFVIGIAFISITQRALKNQIGQRALEMANETIAEIDKMIYIRVTEMQAYANEVSLVKVANISNEEFDKIPNVQDYINIIDKDWKEKKVNPLIRKVLDNELSRTLSKHLEFYKQKYGYKVLAESYVTNRYGVIIGSTGRTSDYLQADEEWYQKAIKEKQFWVGDVEYDKSSDTLSIDIVINLYNDSGKFAGILKGVLNVEDIRNIINLIQSQSQYKSMVPHLVDKDGLVIFSNVNGRLKELGEDIRLADFGKDFSYREVVAQVIKGKDGFAVYTEGGKELLSSFAHSKGIIDFKGFGWSIIIDYETDEIFGHIVRLRNIIVIIYTVFLIVAIILSIFIARSILTRITKLINASARVGGILDTKVDIAAKDEFNELITSFNKMTMDLQKVTVSKDYLDNIIKSMTTTLVVARTDGAIEIVNQAALDLLGYTEDELISKSIVTIFAPKDELKRYGIKRLIKKGFIKNVESTYIAKNGKELPVLFSSSVMHDGNGKISGIVCLAQDITEYNRVEKERKVVTVVERKRVKELEDAFNILEKVQDASLNIMEDLGMERTRLEHEVIERKKLQEAISSEKERLSVTLHSISDGVIATDNKGNVVMANRVAQELTGCSQEQASGRPLTEIFHIINEKTREIAENPIEKALKNGEIVKLANGTTLIAANRTERIIASSAAPMHDKDGKVIGAVLVFRDITEQSRLEEERDMIHLKMMQSGKLASLGEVATGVAHEINQPLSYISSVIQCLQIDLVEDTIDKNELDKRLKISLKQVYRINNIIQHLRSFGRRDDIIKRLISLEVVLNNTLLLMGEQIRLKSIKLVKNIKPNLPKVIGNQNQLEQVFINLFQNALDVVEKKSMDAELHVDMLLSQDKESVVIKVEDNGEGIEPEYLDKIFEPFFTTKEVGKGTGLGLSIIYGIIRDHNGTITCESEVSKGTAFTITLPVGADAK